MDLNNIFLWVLIGAGSLLALVLAWAGVKYRALIVERIKNERVQGILTRLGDFVFKVVTELNQTVVEQLKKDGKWNADEAAKVKQMALDKVKSYLGADGIKEAMEILGIDNKALEALLISFIESQVSLVKPTPEPAA